MKRELYLITLILLGYCYPIYGQYQLEKIIVEGDVSNENGTESNNSQKILNEESIKQHMPSNVDDLLQSSVEATTTRGPRVSGEGIQVRGFDPNKIFILVDGVRQNYREGHSTMNPIDLENIKGVVIQKNSTDFSKSGSLSGGIEFISKTPKDYLKDGKDWGTELSYRNNSANFEQSLNAKGIAQKGKHSSLISLTATQADDLSLNNGRTLENSSFEDMNGLFKYHYQDTYFSYEKYYRKDDSPLDPSLNPPENEQSLHANSFYYKDTFNAGYTKQYLKALAYSNTYVTKRVDRETKLTQKRKIQTLGSTFKDRKNDFNYGVEFYQDKLNSDLSGANIADYPNSYSINSSTFLDRSFEVKSYTITPGLQFAHYSLKADRSGVGKKKGSRLSKKIRIDQNINQSVSVYALYSEGFNAPDVMEVYPEGLHSAGDGFILRDNYFIPNEQLNYESSITKELGLEFKHTVFSQYDLIKFRASYYQNDVQDYIKIQRIDRSTADTEDGTSQFINIPDVSLEGGEAEINYYIENSEASVAYSFIRGKNISESLYLEDLPADQIVYQYKYFWEPYKCNFGYLGKQALRQNRTNPQTIQRTEKTSGYFIHNAFIDKEIGENWMLSFRANNLGNKNYRRHASFLNESSEDFRIMVKWKINTN